MQGAHKSALKALIADMHDSDAVPANVQMLLDSLLPCYFGKLLDAIVDGESRGSTADGMSQTGGGASEAPLLADAPTIVGAPLDGFRMDWGRAHAVLVSKELMGAMADNPEVRLRLTGSNTVAQNIRNFVESTKPSESAVVSLNLHKCYNFDNTQ